MEKNKSVKSANRLVMLSIDEYARLNNSGRVRISKERSRTQPKTKGISSATFNTLLLKAPDVGLNAESYVLVAYKSKPEDIFLDIRNVHDCWAVNENAASLLELKAFPHGDNLWEKYIHQTLSEEKKYNGSFFLEILDEYKSDISLEALQQFSLSENIAFNVSGLNPEEVSSLSKVMMTYAFGWKSALTVMRRLAKEYAGDVWKSYWTVPSVQDELENIRRTKSSGSILSDPLYQVLRPLDKSLWNIEGCPKIPLAYLAVIFHYGGFAENDKDFSIDDFRTDLEIVKQDCGPEWVSAAIYLVGQCLSGKKLMNIYHSIKKRNVVQEVSKQLIPQQFSLI